MRWLAVWIVLLLAFPVPGLGGTLEGEVVLKSPLKKRPVGRRQKALRYGQTPSETYHRAGSEAAEVDETRNVVVYLLGAPGAGEGAFPAPTMTQKGRQFSPYVLVVKVGTRVEFPNQDIIYHSVYSESETRRFDLPEYPKGESRQVLFEKPGVVELFCAIHARMNAYILVLPDGYFSQPDERHHYRITGVPPGKYVLKAWHPRLEPASRVVEVKEPATTVDLTL